MKNNFNEVSPPGWGGTVNAMVKHHPEIKNPWALAWYEKNKGDKPHYKNDPDGSKSKKKPEKKEKYKEGNFKEWLELRESRHSKKGCKCKKCKLKYALNIEGEPTIVGESNLETARVTHSAITKMGYGIGRPKVQGDSLIYQTGDPEDAEMIANDIPARLAQWGIQGTATVQDRNIIVTIKG